MGAFAEALRSLALAQKSAKGVSLYSRYVNRPAGRVLAAACYAVGIGPNGVTLVSAILSACGLLALVMVSPAWWLGPLVAFLLLLGFAFDSADGQVARLSGRSSAAGEWLDHVVDAGKMVALHAAVLIASWRYLDTDDAWLLVPLGYQFTSVVMFAGGTLTDLLIRGRPAAAPQSLSVVRAIGLLPADYGILATAFLLWGSPNLFVPVYTLLFVLNVAILVALLVRWFRRLASPGEA